MVLRMDRAGDPLNSPLIDSLDFVHRLQSWPTRSDIEELRFTAIDFSALHTNFMWTDVADAYEYWHSYLLSRLNLDLLSPNEVLHATWLLSTISHSDFLPLVEFWPYLSIPHSADLSIGLVLFNFVWNHNVFHAPTEGIFRQVYGFSMGTNCAAPWANLILRYYEKTRCFDTADCPRLWLSRFIDDVCLVHPSSFSTHIVTYLKSMYPVHLPFTIDVVGTRGGFNFLDVRVISLHPLIHCVHFKDTRTCNYIPFCSDTPIHVRRGWIFGECVRYLWLNSHAAFYSLCLRCLRLALVRLGNPSSWFSPFPVTWFLHHSYMHRKMRPLREVVHVFRVRYNGAVRMNWGNPVKSLLYSLRHLMPTLHLFCIMQPSMNLRGRFHGAKIRSLLSLERRIFNHVDTLEMPTQDLLLNLH